MSNNVYAYIQGINAIASMIVASIIFSNKRQNPIHLSYVFFYIVLFLFTFPYFLWGIETDKDRSLFLLKLLMYPICFIHVVYLHYVLILTDRIREHKSWLIFGYLSSLSFAWMVYVPIFYNLNHVRSKGPFLFWPHATAYLWLLIITEVFYVLFSFIILWSASKTKPNSARVNLRIYLIISIK